jgi:hypothetical protein
MPSWRAPITNSAANTVSGFGQTATNAMAAKTSAQSTPIEIHERRSLCTSSGASSSRVSAERQSAFSGAEDAMFSSPQATRRVSVSETRVSAGALRCGTS